MCLVAPVGGGARPGFELVDITYETTAARRALEAALAAPKFSPEDKQETASPRSQPQPRNKEPFPSRGGDALLVCQRAIARFNPNLRAREIDAFANPIVRYSAEFQLDPYLVVALIAAESRFNPRARSHKGAAGLGQLMPATAAARFSWQWDSIGLTPLTWRPRSTLKTTRSSRCLWCEVSHKTRKTSRLPRSEATRRSTNF